MFLRRCIAAHRRRAGTARGALPFASGLLPIPGGKLRFADRVAPIRADVTAAGGSARARPATRPRSVGWPAEKG